MDWSALPAVIELLESRTLPTINVTAPITEDTTWTGPETYVIAADITINAGVTLTIGADVVVQTNSQFNDITVNGTIDASNNARFLGNFTDITVNNGGRFNLTEQCTVAGERVHYAAGSRGTIDKSYFTTAMLILESTQVTVSSTSFSSATPVSAFPSLIPQLYDNTFTSSVPATFYVHGATTSGTTTWNVINNVSTYLLDDDVTVSSSRTLNIGPGLTIRTDSQFNDFLIDGTVDATQVNFTGAETDITVRSGGRLNLKSSSTVAGRQVTYNSGSQGTVTNSTFSSALLYLDSTSVTVDSNTFTTRTDPVSALPSMVPELYDNTFTIQSTMVRVHGGTTGDATWKVIPNLKRYLLDNDLTVAGGTQLTIQDGITVQTNSQFEDIFVDGVFDVTRVTFSGSNTDIIVRNGGRMNLRSGSVLSAGRLNYQSGSLGDASYSEFNGDLYIHSTGTHQIVNNTMLGTVHARGSATATIDLKNNFWGETDIDVIGTQIEDHLDDTSFPTITFDPFLTSTPAEPTNLAIAVTSALKAEGNSGTTPFTFTVTRSGNTTGATTVSYAVTGSGGAPAAASDFGGVLPSGSVSFLAGETSKVITINVTGDTQAETDEGFTVTLSGATGGAVITAASAQGAIFNDDVESAPGLVILATNASLSEGNSGTTVFTFTVNRNGSTTNATNVSYAVTGSGLNPATAADFVGGVFATGGLNFGVGETSKVITINVAGDTQVEPDETFTVTLTNATNGAAIVTATAIGTIQDDDALLGALSLSFSVNSISENGGTAIGTIQRTGSTAAPLVVTLTNNDLSEATVPTLVTIPAGQSSATFVVNSVNDTLLDGTQLVSIAATAPSYSGANATISVTDDELPQFVLSLTSASISEKGGQSSLTIQRTGDISTTLVVSLLISDSTEATIPGSITLEPGQVSLNVPITAVDDLLQDGPQNVSITVSATGYTTSAIPLTVTDDEPATTFVVTTTNDSGAGSLRQALLNANASPGRDAIQFNIGTGAKTISLLSPLPTVTEGIILDATSQPGYAGTPLIELNGTNAGDTAGLMVTGGSSEIRGFVINRFQRQGIAIVNGGGNIIEGNRIGTDPSGQVGQGNGSQGILVQNSAGNRIGGNATGQGNLIANNTAQGISITGTIAVGNLISRNSIFDNGGLEIDLDGNGASLNDTLDNDVGANGLQNYPVIDSANLVNNQTIVVGSLSSSPNAVFRLEFFAGVAGTPSNVGEGRTYLGFLNVNTGSDGTIAWDISFPALELGQKLTATATSLSGNTSEFSVPATVNQLPTISDIADQAFNENAALPLIPFSIGDLETPTASLVVTITSSDTTLVPNNKMTVNGTGLNRTLTIIPAPNRAGQTVITVTVSDGTGSTSDSFVLKINDTPEISVIGNQSTNENSSTAEISFTVGDTETPASSLIVTAQSSKVSLIPIGNIILAGGGANRTITLVPLADQSGTSTITVTARDWGNDGIPNNADDATFSRSFVVTVNAVNDPPTLNEISASLVIDEDALTQTVGLSGISAGFGENQQILITASSSNPSLIPDPVVDYSQGNSTAVLTYRPEANQNGSATITVTVRDPGLDGILDNLDDGIVMRSFAVTVNPINDAPFVSDATFSLPENTATGVAVGSVTVTDEDSNPADRTFSIVNGNGLGIFAINSNSGQITVANNANLNREQISQIVLTVQVNDGNVNSPLTDTATITLNISDVNEFSPEIPGTGFSVPENSPNGTVVGSISATDADATHTLTYAITSGNNLGIFTIDGETGEIKIANKANLDRELVSVVALAITVNDGGPGASRSTTATVAIDITGVNDHAPQITSNTTYVMPENVTGVGNLLASDADLPAQEISFSITGGADSTAFSITSQGVLTFVSPPDFEHPTDAGQDNVYDLIVTANDGAGQSTSRALSVSITNVAEAPQLVLGSQGVDFINKRGAVPVLPQITVGGASDLGGGTLRISVNAVGTAKKFLDQFVFLPTTGLGISTGAHREGDQLVLQIQLSPIVTDAAIQSFLRGITFATKGKGLKLPTRTLAVTLSNAQGLSQSVSQTIRVKKTA